jgi:hypothetical protein
VEKEHALRLFGNEKLRSIFGPKKVDVVGDRRNYTRGSESVAYIR